MRVLEQILMFWAILSVVTGVLIARAWEATERELAPIRIHHRQTRPAEAHHTAV